MQGHEPAGLPQGAQRRECGSESKCIVELDQLRLSERASSTQAGVRRCAARDDGGEAVEAAAQQHEHEAAAALDLRESDIRQRERGEAAEAHLVTEGAAIHLISTEKLGRPATAPRVPPSRSKSRRRTL